MRLNRQALSIGGAGVAVAAAAVAVIVFGQPASSHPTQQPTLATASSSFSTSTAQTTVAATTSTVVATTTHPALTTAPAATKTVRHAVAQDATTTNGSDPVVTGTNSYGVPITKSAPPAPPAMCNVAPPNEPASLVPCPTN